MTNALLKGLRPIRPGEILREMFFPHWAGQRLDEHGSSGKIDRRAMRSP